MFANLNDVTWSIKCNWNLLMTGRTSYIYIVEVETEHTGNLTLLIAGTFATVMINQVHLE